MTRGCVFLLCVLLLACGESRQSEYGPVPEVIDYLEKIKDILQEVRVLDQQIAQAVPADSVQAEVIVPLIEARFRPVLATLYERAQKIEHGQPLAPTHQKLLDYLRLRLQAFDLVLQGDRENRPELFEAFGRCQIEADAVGRSLEKTLLDIQQSLQQAR